MNTMPAEEPYSLFDSQNERNDDCDWPSLINDFAGYLDTQISRYAASGRSETVNAFIDAKDALLGILQKYSIDLADYEE